MTLAGRAAIFPVRLAPDNSARIRLRVVPDLGGGARRDSRSREGSSTGEARMRRHTWGERLRYAFDNTLARGPAAMIVWLALASGALILLISLIAWAAGAAPGRGFVEIVWMSLMRTLDAGTMGGDAGGWPFLLLMLAVTFGGIFVISTLIGVLTSGIEGRLENLRKGRSRVVEEGHTAILGWSEQIFPILGQLVIANANRPRACIVVLAEKDKVEMEEEIRQRLGGTGRTRIVCRNGSPIEMADLDLVSVQTTRAIIVLSPESEDPDVEVIKALLAIRKSPNRRPSPYHVVAELRDAKNLEVAQLVGEGEVEIVLVGDLVARTIAQTCRQSGLSVVHTELLDFGGDEIYFHQEPALVGKRFREALLAYDDSAVIGVRPKGAPPKINPPMEAEIRNGDEIVVISEDDDTIRLSGIGDPGIRAELIQAAVTVPGKPERALVLGWSSRTPSILNELDHYVAPGSQVDVVAEFGDGEGEIARCCPGIRNEKVTYRLGDTTDRRLLERLPLADYDHIIVLASSQGRDRQHADARTLVTLLHLRDIAERRNLSFSIVSEILDVRNRSLAAVTRADDFVVSDQLASLMLSQVAEHKSLNAVLSDIFDPEGSEIYLKPAAEYVRLNEAMSFYTVVEAAARRGQVALGYRRASAANDASAAYGVVVNPEKSKPVSFSADDRIIVLAEE